MGLHKHLYVSNVSNANVSKVRVMTVVSRRLYCIWSWLPGGLVESPSLERLKTQLSVSWAACCDWPCFETVISRSPFQHFWLVSQENEDFGEARQQSQKSLVILCLLDLVPGLEANPTVIACIFQVPWRECWFSHVIIISQYFCWHNY